MKIDIPDRLVPLHKVLLKQHLEAMRTQAHLYGAGHPEAKRLAEALKDARELAEAVGLPTTVAA